MGLYDRYLDLRTRTHEGSAPSHVALVLTERDLLERGAYERLELVLDWAFEGGAERVTVYVSVLDPAAAEPLMSELADLDAPRPVAVRALATEVDEGDRAPDDVTADDIEGRLVFPDEPDLVIKTGAERLSDFMIWQSVYSELYFTDVNWRDFRRRDYLRAVLDYKNRQRRFGR